jgi:hypothetical protein
MPRIAIWILFLAALTIPAASSDAAELRLPRAFPPSRVHDDAVTFAFASSDRIYLSPQTGLLWTTFRRRTWSEYYCVMALLDVQRARFRFTLDFDPHDMLLALDPFTETFSPNDPNA